jgi:F-type H+-transporting ATPase subunit b
MLIDWFTVGAQVLNFLILVWLLKHFLYQPILTAIDAREARIAGELADADAKKAEAAKERADFEQKNAAFDQEKAKQLSQAKAAADSERQRLLDAARQDAADLAAKRQESLRQEAQNLHQEIRRRTQQEVFAIARKALGDLAGAKLEEQMVKVFVDRLQALGTEEKKALVTALQAKVQPIAVHTSVDLKAAEQKTLTKAIQALLGEKTAIRFATTADLVSGIELSSDGHKLAWSIDGYLADLENGIGELLKAKAPEPDAPEKARTDAS